MNAISIRKETSPKGGRYVATVEGKPGEAELKFTNRASDIVSADHVGAPDGLRGTGAALALIERMIDEARTHGFKIAPVCPYVAAQSRKHPEWQDVMTADG